jgi:hypothetical protein
MGFRTTDSRQPEPDRQIFPSPSLWSLIQSHEPTSLTLFRHLNHGRHTGIEDANYGHGRIVVDDISDVGATPHYSGVELGTKIVAIAVF